MDPVTLIVTALAAGAASALQDDAKGSVKAALTRLRTLARKRLSRQPGGEFVLTQHEKTPDIYGTPLEHELRESGATGDPDLISVAQELMKLLDEQGTAAGKYAVTVHNSAGVQVGDHNTQVTHFGVTAGRDAYYAGRDMTVNPH